MPAVYLVCGGRSGTPVAGRRAQLSEMRLKSDDGIAKNVWAKVGNRVDRQCESVGSD